MERGDEGTAPLVGIKVDPFGGRQGREIATQRLGHRPVAHGGNRALDILDEEAVQDADLVFGGRAVIILAILFVGLPLLRDAKHHLPGRLLAKPDFDERRRPVRMRREARPSSKQTGEVNDFGSRQGLLAGAPRRPVELALGLEIAQQLLKLELAVGKGGGAQRRKPGLAHAAKRPGQSGHLEAAEKWLARRIEPETGKTGIPVQIASLRILVNGPFVTRLRGKLYDPGNLGLAEHAEEYGEPQKLLVLRNMRATQLRLAVLRLLRMDAEDAPAFLRDRPTGQVERDEELDLVPEFENGQQPLPVLNLRIHTPFHPLPAAGRPSPRP